MQKRSLKNSTGQASTAAYSVAVFGDEPIDIDSQQGLTGNARIGNGSRINLPVRFVAQSKTELGIVA